MMMISKSSKSILERADQRLNSIKINHNTTTLILP